MPSAKTVITFAAIAAATIFLINRFSEKGVSEFGKPPAKDA